VDTAEATHGRPWGRRRSRERWSLRVREPGERRSGRYRLGGVRNGGRRRLAHARPTSSG